MLDDRARMLLKTLIERYIEDGDPVGSRTLSKSIDITLSPATIRNVLSDLEELGLITSPHTSAGRIPTTQGYRFFVDTLLTAQSQTSLGVHQLTTPSSQYVLQQTTATQNEILHSAADVLSKLSHFVGVVRAPKSINTIHHIEFLRIYNDRILVILISPNGEVQNRIIYNTQDLSQQQLNQAAELINETYLGLTLQQVRVRVGNEMSRIKRQIKTLLEELYLQNSTPVNKVYIAGQSHLFEVKDFNDKLINLKGLFEMFEHQTQLLSLLELSNLAEGVRIYIGGESEQIAQYDLSVVAAPYERDGQVVGTLGVIGPTRMSYGKMIEIVNVTAKNLGEALTRA